MKEITFWRALSPKYSTKIIQGYEIKYEKTIGGEKPYYKHFVHPKNKEEKLTSKTF